jgi:hypothetical protein
MDSRRRCQRRRHTHMSWSTGRGPSWNTLRRPLVCQLNIRRRTRCLHNGLHNGTMEKKGDKECWRKMKSEGCYIRSHEIFDSCVYDILASVALRDFGGHDCNASLILSFTLIICGRQVSASLMAKILEVGGNIRVLGACQATSNELLSSRVIVANAALLSSWLVNNRKMQSRSIFKLWLMFLVHRCRCSQPQETKGTAGGSRKPGRKTKTRLDACFSATLALHNPHVQMTGG